VCLNGVPSCAKNRTHWLIMDINSVEFYTIAFVVAMALIALLVGRTEKKPPSTYIIQLDTIEADGEEADRVRLEAMDDGRVRICRQGLMLNPGETINLVFTIRDEQCHIVEKKGLKRRGANAVPITGEATVKWLRRGHKYRIRYESQVMSTWVRFTFDPSSSSPVEAQLNI